MIKEISLKDVKEISELFIDCFNSHPWNENWTYETASKRLIDIINTPGFIGISFYNTNELVGIIMGRIEQYYNGINFQILEFCISRKMQSKGYGSMLLNEFIKKLKEKDIANVCLLTLHGDSTEGFYKKNGFTTMEDMSFMSKKIK